MSLLFSGRFRRALLPALLLGATCGVHADDAVVGNGHAVGCDETAFDAALGQLYPGANFPGGNITFNCGPGPVTIVFTSAKGIGLNSGTTIDGGGLVTLDGGNATRLFNITGSESRVELRNLVIERGYALGDTGGAIHVASGNALLIADSIVRDSESTASGGAIYADIDTGLALERSTLIGNSAVNGGGLMTNGALALTDSLLANNHATLEGGGMVVYGGEVELARSRFENNSATDGGGALLRGSEARFEDAGISDNVASGRGGGVAVYGTQTLVLVRTQLLRNVADQGGGVHVGGIDDGASNENTTRTNVVLAAATRFEANQAREGGGAYVFGVVPAHTGRVGALLVEDATFVGNNAERGGAIHNQGYLEGGPIYVRDNTANDGGGLYLPPTVEGALGASFIRLTGHVSLTFAYITRNTATHAGGGVYANAALMFGEGILLHDNYSAFGGGIAFVDSAVVVVDRMTIADNRATQQGGGVFIDSVRGGAAIHNSTLSNNRVDASGIGGQVFVTTDISVDPGARSELDITDSTLYGGGVAAAGVSLYADVASNIRYSGSILGHPDGMGCGAGPASSVGSNGFNLQAGFSCDSGGLGDSNVTLQADLGLAGLAPNGALSFTHLPRRGSPAVDHHPCVGTNLVDQRDVERPVDADGDGLAWCDAGAVERMLVEDETLFADGFENDDPME